MLSEFLEGDAPSVGNSDRIRWTLDQTQEFQVHTLRRLLGQIRWEGQPNLSKTDWMRCVPLKVCIFIWRAKLGRIPTRSVLATMGIDLDSVLCPRCQSATETVQHALFECEEVKTVWRLIGKWWNIDSEDSNSFQSIVDCSNQLRANSATTKRWTATVWSTLYFIWANRNKIVFQKEEGKLVDRFFQLQTTVFEWLSRRDRERKMDWNQWLTMPQSC